MVSFQMDLILDVQTDEWWENVTAHGAIDAALLYESPFTDITPIGPYGLFTSSQVD
jgi:type I site-specific restriction endonuclease